MLYRTFSKLLWQARLNYHRMMLHHYTGSSDNWVSHKKVKYGSMIAMHLINASLNTKGQNVGVKTTKKKSGRMELFFLVKTIPTMIPILEMTFSKSIRTAPMMWTLLYSTHGIENRETILLKYNDYIYSYDFISVRNSTSIVWTLKQCSRWITVNFFSAVETLESS